MKTMSNRWVRWCVVILGVFFLVSESSAIDIDIRIGGWGKRHYCAYPGYGYFWPVYSYSGRWGSGSYLIPSEVTVNGPAYYQRRNSRELMDLHLSIREAHEKLQKSQEEGEAGKKD